MNGSRVPSHHVVFHWPLKMPRTRSECYQRKSPMCTSVLIKALRNFCVCPYFLLLLLLSSAFWLCCETCGILVPQLPSQGLNLRPQQWLLGICCWTSGSPHTSFSCNAKLCNRTLYVFPQIRYVQVSPFHKNPGDEGPPLMTLL